MAIFSFNDSNGKSFDIKGPAGLTLEQAKQIFDKQSSSGSLVGLKPGSVLSAATQAQAGLAAAQAQLGQALSGITGALGGGIASSVGEVGKLANNALGSVNNALGSVNNALGSVNSIASKATAAVNSALSAPSSGIGGIDVAKYAKQATALVPIGSINVPQMTGVLAQAKSLVGQASDKLTNNKGVGSFGLDVKQLETAGILKPGTSKFVAAGSKALSSVLKSPSVFTGKGGITDAKSLLSSSSSQEKIQQGLMAQGTAGLKSIGIPMDKLDASKAAGLALNAAKSLPNTEALIKGLPLPPDIKSKMTEAVALGSFAVKLSDKLPNVFKEQEAPVPAADTANRDTLDAAASRVVGNEKIPTPNYGAKPMDVPGEVAEITDAYSEAISTVVGTTADLVDLKNELTRLNKQDSVSRAEFDVLNATYIKIKDTYNSVGLKIVLAARALRESKSSKAQLETNSVIANFNTFSSKLVEELSAVQKLLKQIEAKIAE